MSGLITRSISQASFIVRAWYAQLHPSSGQRYPLAYHACRSLSSYAALHSSHVNHVQQCTVINGKSYAKDDWTNVPASIISLSERKLHIQPLHPICITRCIIESSFPSQIYTVHNRVDPVVTTYENFDSLEFPPDHPGRRKSDTFYVNRQNVLRTHTSAHQIQLFRENKRPGYVLSADVYRRDSVDKSHYPLFHQMEGARLWDNNTTNQIDVVERICLDTNSLSGHDLPVLRPLQLASDENPLQEARHTQAQVNALAQHLFLTLESMIVDTLSRARANGTEEGPFKDLKLRWVNAYFPFTAPSWELEIYWQGQWLEVLGCGIVKQGILDKAGHESKIGWAFGIGIERLAMLLFSIPDIRLFWSQDRRFLDQFSSEHDITQFVPFSKYPSCPKDISFWINKNRTMDDATKISTSPPRSEFHENELMEVIREAGEDIVENVELIDKFTHPRSCRKSLCYRLNYRSHDKTLENDEVDRLHRRIGEMLAERVDIELR